MNRHGKVLLFWNKDILTVQAKGPFNEEGALAEINKIKVFILQKNAIKWYKLRIWDEESLGSSEAINMAKNYHKWCLENGCVKTAYVVCNSIQKSISEKIYSGTAKIFQSEYDAKKWLLSDI